MHRLPGHQRSVCVKHVSANPYDRCAIPPDKREDIHEISSTGGILPCKDQGGDKWKAAFNCPMGSFQFQVMPFILQGAPDFMQLISEVLHKHLYQKLLVSLNDILIYT